MFESNWDKDNGSIDRDRKGDDPECKGDFDHDNEYMEVNRAIERIWLI